MPRNVRIPTAVRVLLVALAAGVCASCIPIRTDSPDDYIGPPETRPTPPPKKGLVGSILSATFPKPAEAPTTATVETSGPLRLTVLDAIVLALENNRALRVEQVNPAIRRTFEHEERAAFDPVLTATASRERQRSRRLARAGAGTESSTRQVTAGDLLVSTFLPTGTTVDLEASAVKTESTLYLFPFSTVRGGLSVTQALLRGFGTGVNLASLRQARLDTQASQYELRGFAEALVAQVEQTYWDYALAQREIQIVTNSLELAEQQMRETQERINVGRLAETELAAAEAEVALRREALINARSTLAKTRLQLLRLVNPPGANLWERTVEVLNEPAAPDMRMDPVYAHAQLALRMRPELNQARLAIQRGELEVVKTRNGLLPRLDAFVTLGKSGYADSVRLAFNDLEEKSYDWMLGAQLEYPLGNRRPQALHKRSTLSLDQTQEALGNLAQLVDVDVRTAYIEVNRTREQAAATSATRRLQEETLRVEIEKFRVGKSTALLVAQAQRDLLAAQIAEVRAVVNHLKALVELWRLEGSLLERRGIDAPGAIVVDLSRHPTWWK